jgi:phospho-N-acetylmuramoyl-pentapeptide-transferase
MIDLGSFSSEILKTFLLLLLGLGFSLLITPFYSHLAYKHKLWKIERDSATTGEKLTVVNRLTIKRDVPTMAGLIMLLAAVIVTVFFNLDRQQTWLPLAGLVGGGMVGLLDDVINLRSQGRGVAGLRAPIKFGLITAVAAASALFFYFKLDYSTIQLPFLGDVTLGLFLIPLFVLAVVSTSNAVNISDGLDGLAGGLLLSAFGAFGVIAALQGNFGIAGFCMTIIGTLLAYVWFNIPPARFFMGDVGSFSLGTALGVVAMLTDTLFLLPIIGLIFVLEAGSSGAQILSKKIFKRRIFIAAPLHHHLEAGGWPKTKVTMRFWIIGQVCAIVGITIAIVGGY